jgi:hypothetical protein
MTQKAACFGSEECENAQMKKEAAQTLLVV